MKSPKRGEIWWVNFDPTRGSEQAGTRPALIIQNDIGNIYSRTTIVAAISTKITDYPQNTIIEPSNANTLKQKSIVKLGQILTVDKSRCTKHIGNISNQELEKVDKSIALSLGLK